jgi:hypothetical protein
MNSSKLREQEATSLEPTISRAITSDSSNDDRRLRIMTEVGEK